MTRRFRCESNSATSHRPVTSFRNTLSPRSSQDFREGGFADVHIDVTECELRMFAIKQALYANAGLSRVLQQVGCAPALTFQKLIDRAFEMDLVGRHERKALHFIRRQANEAKHIFE